MRITAVETFCVRLDADEAYLGRLPSGADPRSRGDYFVRPPWKSLYSARFESFLVRLTTEDGHVGWGEALAPVAPEVLDTIVDRIVAPVLIGQDPRPVLPLWHRLTGLMRERGHLAGHQADALAAVDIVLWDLRERILGVPVHQLLGGAFRDRMRSVRAACEEYR